MPDQQKFDELRATLIAFGNRFSSDETGDGWLKRLGEKASDKFDLINAWIEEAREARRLEQESKYNKR